MTLPPPPRLPARAPSPGLKDRHAPLRPERPGQLLRGRTSRLVHPYCRRARPSDTGG